jgi:F0F1-type ATP synthase membrane subunit b/b'
LKLSIRPLLLPFLACLLALAGGIPAKSSPLALSLVSNPEPAAEGGETQYPERYKVINFVLLVGVLTFLVRKPLAEFLVQRSASIRYKLEQGRRALAATQAQLREIEQKLNQLGEEIRAFKEEAAREARAERDRLRKTTAEEAEKILELARAQIETATRAGVRELKRYAAREALKHAEELIRERLDDATHRQLVSRFVGELIQN